MNLLLFTSWRRASIEFEHHSWIKSCKAQNDNAQWIFLHIVSQFKQLFSVFNFRVSYKKHHCSIDSDSVDILYEKKKNSETKMPMNLLWALTFHWKLLCFFWWFLYIKSMNCKLMRNALYFIYLLILTGQKMVGNLQQLVIS
jgi:hypothetical protein